MQFESYVKLTGDQSNKRISFLMCIQEEEKGIEMSEDFEGRVQDFEQKDDEEGDSDEENDEEEPDKEMGETDAGADRLDQQVSGMFESCQLLVRLSAVRFCFSLFGLW
jgi:hypothetical protein